MKNLGRIIVISVLTGAAAKAGMQLWDNVLSEKTAKFLSKVFKKTETN